LKQPEVTGAEAAIINTARLAERCREANGDPVRMAAALGEELSQNDTQLATRADLLALVAELRAEMNDLKAWTLTRLIAMFGIALAIIGLMIRFLTPTAGSPGCVKTRSVVGCLLAFSRGVDEAFRRGCGSRPEPPVARVPG
jgi:hypothetical protein